MSLIVFDRNQRAVFNRVRLDDDSAIHNLVSIEDFLTIYVPALKAQGIHPTKCIEKCFDILLSFPHLEDESTTVWDSLFFYCSHILSLLNSLVCAYPTKGFGMHKEIYENMMLVNSHMMDFKKTLYGAYTTIQAIIYPHVSDEDKNAITFNLLEKEDTTELYEMMRLYHGYKGPFLLRGSYSMSPFILNTEGHCSIMKTYVIDNMKHYKAVGHYPGSDVHTLLIEPGGTKWGHINRSLVVEHLATVGFDRARAEEAYDAATNVGQSVSEVARLIHECLFATRVDLVALPADFLEC